MDGNVQAFAPAVVLALACFVAGTLMGYSLGVPQFKRRSVSRISMPAAALDQVQ